jgi:hypothetical protein
MSIRYIFIIPATTTTTPYISYNWLQAGAIVVNVSLDDVMPDVVITETLLAWVRVSCRSSGPNAFPSPVPQKEIQG